MRDSGLQTFPYLPSVWTHHSHYLPPEFRLQNSSLRHVQTGAHFGDQGANVSDPSGQTGSIHEAPARPVTDITVGLVRGGGYVEPRRSA